MDCCFQARGIYCLNPKRIAIAGKIRVFCFDKTGTLTHEGLDFIGAQSVVRSGSGVPTFGHLTMPANGDGMDPSTLHGLATCHAVTKFGNQFVGNQVEVIKPPESFKENYIFVCASLLQNA